MESYSGWGLSPATGQTKTIIIVRVAGVKLRTGGTTISPAILVSSITHLQPIEIVLQAILHY